MRAHHHTYPYVNTDKYKKPRWMKIVKSITIVVLSIILILAIIGMVIHSISHYK